VRWPRTHEPAREEFNEEVAYLRTEAGKDVARRFVVSTMVIHVAIHPPLWRNGGQINVVDVSIPPCSRRRFANPAARGTATARTGGGMKPPPGAANAPAGLRPPNPTWPSPLAPSPASGRRGTALLCPPGVWRFARAGGASACSRWYARSAHHRKPNQRSHPPRRGGGKASLWRIRHPFRVQIRFVRANRRCALRTAGYLPLRLRRRVASDGLR
jgi:hypothetical protein